MENLIDALKKLNPKATLTVGLLLSLLEPEEEEEEKPKKVKKGK